MSLISTAFQLRFREFCTDISLSQITSIFNTANIQKAELTDKLIAISGQRRQLVEQYYASINWDNFQDCNKFLEAVAAILVQSYINEEEKSALRELCVQEGFVFDGNRIYLGSKGVQGKLKNLVFAANGPKPKIVLIDAMNNDIKITQNAEYCLVYDRPFTSQGLLWVDLLDWWISTISLKLATKREYEEKLYRRLEESLNSPPEVLLFRTYFESFHKQLGAQLPALIPQVYLHYDPYTITFLDGIKDLARQRMDFLMLFSHQDRVVIEIDGEQHYSKDGKPNGKLYSEMMSEDRRLKLSGYEIYRFGGYELSQENSKETIISFFQKLFKAKGLS